jgi:hypothetical protein
MRECEKILHDYTYRTSMISSFGDIRKAFSGKRPSRRVAEMIGELAGWSN